MPQPPHLLESWIRTTPPTWKTSWAATWSQSYKLFFSVKSGAQSFSPFRFRKVSESFSGNVHFCILLHLFENGSVCFIFSFCESQISLPESNFKDERDLHFGSVFRFSGPEFFRLVGKFVSPEAKKWRRQLLFGLCLLSLPIFFSAGGDFWPKFWIGRMISRPLLDQFFLFLGTLFRTNTFLRC